MITTRIQKSRPSRISLYVDYDYGPQFCGYIDTNKKNLVTLNHMPLTGRDAKGFGYHTYKHALQSFLRVTDYTAAPEAFQDAETLDSQRLAGV